VWENDSGNSALQMPHSATCPFSLLSFIPYKTFQILSFKWACLFLQSNLTCRLRTSWYSATKKREQKLFTYLRNTFFFVTPCNLVGDYQSFGGTFRLFFAFMNVCLVNIETYGTINSLPLLYPARSRWGTYRGCCSRRDGAGNSS
jgi:hypothetical protein